MDDIAHESYAYAGKTPPADVRQTHVAETLCVAEGEGQRLLDSLRELEQRLSDVLRSEIQTPEKSVSDAPHASLVPLAERLTTHGNTVRMARQYVTSILERLEL